MELKPPTIEEVLADYGIDVDQLAKKDNRGRFICVHEGCRTRCNMGRDLSRHNSNRHDKSIMETLGDQQAYDGAWEDALWELVEERGYSLAAIAQELPTHTGRRRIEEDAEEYGIDHEARVANGPGSKFQHFKPEEVGLSPIGEVNDD